MKIAVTGGGGFIGTYVTEWGLDQGHQVWSFDTSNGKSILGDLDHLGDAEAVIHMAGLLGTHELFEAVEEAIQVNVLGSARIMNWCLQHDAAYVGILMPDVFPSIYTATKIATHRLALALQHSEGLRMAHVRAYNAYGPRQKWGKGHPQKIIPTFAVNAWRRQPIPVFGSGLQTVDLIHASDIARMLVDATALASSSGDIVLDAGTGVGLTVRAVAMSVARMTGWTEGEDVVINRLPMRKGERETHIIADGQGWDLLDWRPRFDMKLLDETVDWYGPRATLWEK